MTTEFRVSIGHLSSPSSSGWNNLVAGLLVPGIYQGGQIIPGGTFTLKIEPFLARTPEHTIRVTGDEWFPISAPNGVSGSFSIVTYVLRNNRQQDEVKVEVISPSSITDDMVVLGSLEIPDGSLEITAEMISTDLTVRKSLDSSTFFGRIFAGEGVFKDDNVITHNLGHTKYSVIISPEDTTLNIGDVTTERTANEITVSNTGSARSAFTWTVVVHSEFDIAAGVIYGQTLVSSTPIVLTHNLGHQNYFPAIIPLEPATDTYWAGKSDTTITLETSGADFRAIWAVIPTQATHINGSANFITNEVIHNLGHTDYRMFITALESGGPSNPYFLKEINRANFQTPGTGQFQYLIIEDSNALAGQLNFGSRANHQLNRDDYIPLVQTLDSQFISIVPGRNTLHLNNGTVADFITIPANASWALGEWTRPSITPLAPRIEFKGAAYSTDTLGDVVYRELVSQDNYLSSVLLQLHAAIAEAFDVTLELYINNVAQFTNVTSDGPSTITIGNTTNSNTFTPILVEIGDLIEIKLLTNPPAGSILFNFFGSGNIQLNP